MYMRMRHFFQTYFQVMVLAFIALLLSLFFKEYATPISRFFYIFTILRVVPYEMKKEYGITKKLLHLSVSFFITTVLFLIVYKIGLKSVDFILN